MFHGIIVQASVSEVIDQCRGGICLTKNVSEITHLTTVRYCPSDGRTDIPWNYGENMNFDMEPRTDRTVAIMRSKDKDYIRQMTNIVKENIKSKHNGNP